MGFFIYCNSYDYMLYGKRSTEMCPVLIYKLVSLFKMGWRKKGGVKWVVHILYLLNCDVYSLSLSLYLWFHIFRQLLHSERERNLLFCINCKVYIHVHNVILYNHFFHVSTIYFTLYLQL